MLPNRRHASSSSSSSSSRSRSGGGTTVKTDGRHNDIEDDNATDGDNEGDDGYQQQQRQKKSYGGRKRPLGKPHTSGGTGGGGMARRSIQRLISLETTHQQKQQSEDHSSGRNSNKDDDRSDDNNKISYTTASSSKRQRKNTTDFKVTPIRKTGRRTNDDIHTTIRLCPTVVTILDTPQVQRLRFLKQLAVAEYAYVAATHTRFAHSLGVAHLAEKMGLLLQQRQPRLGVTDKDVLCLKLAGLCHDLGHGPFSHVYDGNFRNQVKQSEASGKDRFAHWKTPLPEVPEEWEHEHASLMMVDALLLELGLAIDMDHLDEPLKQVGDGIPADNLRVYAIGGYDEDDNDDEEEADEADEADDSTEQRAPHLLSSRSSSRHRGISREDDDDDDDMAIDENVPYRDRRPPQVLTSRDWVFIKECIYGKPLPSWMERGGERRGEDSKRKVDFIGRPPEKEFLYDIVTNRHSGLDVDKIDYFARDQRCVFRGSGEIENLFVEEAFVAWGRCSQPRKCFQCKNCPESPKLHLMICYPEKLIKAAMEFFRTRFRLFSAVYTHKTVSAAALMISDILLAADPHFEVSTRLLHQQGDGEDENDDKKIPPYLPISRAMMHPAAYLNLNDSIIHVLAAQTRNPNLKKARDLIGRLLHRELYKCAETYNIIPEEDDDLWELTEDEIRAKLVGGRGKKDDVADYHHQGRDGEVRLEWNDVRVEKLTIHHGMKENNPVTLMRFVAKQQLSKTCKSLAQLPEAKCCQLALLQCTAPARFMERSIRLYCTGSDEKKDLVKHLWERWMSERSDAQGGDDNAEMAPNTASQFPEAGASAAMLSQETEWGGDDDRSSYLSPLRPPPVQSQSSSIVETTPPRPSSPVPLPSFGGGSRGGRTTFG